MEEIKKLLMHLRVFHYEGMKENLDCIFISLFCVVLGSSPSYIYALLKVLHVFLM